MKILDIEIPERFRSIDEWSAAGQAVLAYSLQPHRTPAEAAEARAYLQRWGDLFPPRAMEVETAEDMQKIVNTNEKLVKELKDGESSNRL